MMSSHVQGGFVLVTVLFVTAIGLLFGVGALLLFRYQCQLRIDRQHELEKVYAVRSAMNYIRTCTVGIDNYGEQVFRYNTGSGRDLNLLVKPVDPIFPNAHCLSHLDIGSADSSRNLNFLGCINQYDHNLDYEFGAYGATNLLEVLDDRKTVVTVGRRGNSTSTITYGLAVDDPTTTNKPTWWVNVGMRETDGWLSSDYGLRYWFKLDKLAGQSSGGTTDVVRLCLIRNVTNKVNRVNKMYGSVYGWPLSNRGFDHVNREIGERAIVFQIRPDPNHDEDGVMTVEEYVFINGVTNHIPLLRVPGCPWQNANVGMQLANDRVSVFYVDKTQLAGQVGTLSSRGYYISESTNLTTETVNYFKRSVALIDSAGNRTEYGGIYTNKTDGKVHAPELRAVFELEALAARPVADGQWNLVTDFRVTPAYQYDISFLQRDILNGSSIIVTNRATVAQRIGLLEDESLDKYRAYTLLTYDTHGTENKGFRKDEREAERRKNGP